MTSCCVFVFNRYKKLLFYDSKAVSDLATIAFIKHPFSNVFVSIAQPNFSETIVPKALFVESQAAQYLLSAENVAEKQSIEYKPVFDYVFVYPTIDQLGFLSQISSQATILPERYYFLKAMSYFKSTFEHAIVLNKRMHSIDVLFYEKDKIILFNSFSVEHENDIAYYVLLIYNQHLLDQKKVPLMLCGDLVSLKPALEILKMYIQKIENVPFSVETDLQNMDIPYIQHFPLISSVLCE